MRKRIREDERIEYQKKTIRRTKRNTVLYQRHFNERIKASVVIDVLLGKASDRYDSDTAWQVFIQRKGRTSYGGTAED